MHRLLPVLRQQKAFCVMPFDQVCDHFAYYWNRGTFSYSIDDYGEPHGACLIKLFDRLSQFLEPYVHEPNGKFVMIELLVADTPNVMAQLCEDLVTRWGPQDIVLGDRDERTEGAAPRMYTWQMFMKLAKRLTYGLL
jgi:hypothetical protein